MGGEDQNDFTPGFARLRSLDQNHHFLPRAGQGAELQHCSEHGGYRELPAAPAGAAPPKDSVSEALGRALLPPAQAPAEPPWAASFLCQQREDLWAVTPSPWDRDKPTATRREAGHPGAALSSAKAPSESPADSRLHPPSQRQETRVAKGKVKWGGQGGGQTLSGVSAEEDPLPPLS